MQNEKIGTVLFKKGGLWELIVIVGADLSKQESPDRETLQVCLADKEYHFVCKRCS